MEPFVVEKYLVKYLIEKGVDVNKESEDTGEASLFYACSNRNENLLKYFVEQGADINKVSK